MAISKITSDVNSATYVDSVDSLYNIYTAGLGMCVIPNAFVDGVDVSQGKMTLMNVPSRYAQAVDWNTASSVNTTSGTGALIQKVITYPFSKKIKSVDTGTIKFGFLRQGTSSVITLDTVTNTIASSTATVTLPTNLKRKAFVATNTNNFLVCMDTGNNMIIYNCDANGIPSSATAASTTAIPFQTYTGNNPGSWFWHTNYIAEISAVKWQYIWVTLTQEKAANWPGNNDAEATLSGLLYSVSTTGTVTLVNTNAKFINKYSMSAAGGSSGIGWVACSDSYIHNNTAYVVAQAGQTSVSPTTSGARYRALFSIDLTNTTAYTVTMIKKDESLTDNTAAYYPNTSTFHFGYDIGTSTGYFVTNEGTRDIASVTSTVFASTGAQYWAAASNIAYYPRYTNSLTVLQNTAGNLNIAPINNTLNIKGSVCNGTTTNLFSTSFYIYKATGANNQNDNGFMLWMYIPTLGQNSSIGADKVQLLINNTEVASYTISTVGNTINMTTGNVFWTLTIPNTVLSTPATKLTIALKYDNIYSILTKIWFWVTSGTFASPVMAQWFIWSSGAGVTGLASTIAVTFI